MTAEDTSYQGIVVIEYDSFGKGANAASFYVVGNFNLNAGTEVSLQTIHFLAVDSSVCF